MSDNPPPPSPAQDDDIPTLHVNLPSCYLKPAGTEEPQLPDGTFSFDAQEDRWEPSPADPKRQKFRIQCKNEIVFIAGAQYTYKPNTSLYIKCKKVTFMPHPTDSSQKTVMVRMPGANAEQSLLAKAGDGTSGTAASVRLGPLQSPSEGPMPWGLWKKVIETIVGATEGSPGADGVTGSQGADAGSLTIEADSYDTSALTDDSVFFIADCPGGKGQQGGDGGNGGGGGSGLNDEGEDVKKLTYVMEKRFTFPGPLWSPEVKEQNRSEYESLVVKGFLGAKGGDGGRQGAGGYGGSGGQFSINLPKESVDDEKLKARFAVQSNVGTPGTPGAAGVPGPGGRFSDLWLFRLPTLAPSEKRNDVAMRPDRWVEVPPDEVRQWEAYAAYLSNGTAPSPANGDAAKALDDQEMQDRRVRAGQHKPTTSPSVIFKEANKQ